MLVERRSIANQVLSSVAYYPKWPTSRGITASLKTESAPIVAAHLADGNRVNVVISPLALGEPPFAVHPQIRRGPLESRQPYLSIGTITPATARLIEAIVKSRLNVIISGGTGKTTFLNVMNFFTPSYERLVTIEESAGLQLQ
ncbi:hypothetical protein DFAR_1830010 [Desulfarculales bacterium]